MKKRISIGLIILVLCFSAFVYQYQREKKCIKTYPIYFSSRFHPYIKTFINSIADHFVIDTGGSFYCQLDDKIASYFQEAQFHRNRKTIDINGGIVDEREFFLENVDFLDLHLSKLYFLKNEDDFFKRGLIQSSFSEFKKQTLTQENATSYIGHKLLKYFNLYFDFSQKNLYLSLPGITPFSQFFYKCLFRFKKTPMEYLPHAGVICKVKTETGIKKFLIDTGSPVTIIKGDLEEELLFNTFMIGNKNYGPIFVKACRTFLFNDFEGIIGMDFLYNKELYLDFESQNLYIK